ncbi:hypothetical protein, partial [Streptomyces sp. SID3343]|uniref:hypothetical protein n=1 Tax=Streptomyces sp. SID3343 TaxID=2690260 RepID=UPI00136C765F
MGVRPTDWNAIGLSADPTPGDPARIEALITSMTSLGSVARDIDEALKAVLDNTADGGFVGKTADALRKRISGPLRAFVQSIADGFENAVRALRTYVDLMPTWQSAADGALTNGRGLAADDPKRAEFAATATAAGAAQKAQAEEAARAVNAAANGIRQPVTDCELFWEAFNILAIILIVPALILGGPLALIAIGVNFALFVKTAVDFAQGKAGILDLFLAGLGMIAPTTKGINVLKLLKDGSKFVWKGIKEFGRGPFELLKRAFTMGGLRSFAFIPGLKDFARFAGSWVKSGALWVGAGALRFPSWAGGMISKGGLLVVNGIKAIPALFRAIPGAIKGFGSATWKFARNELGNGKWLRLILPVDAAEIGKYGLKGALKIGFYERGVLGKFRFGAPLASAGGRSLAQIPTPPLRGLDALTDMPIGDLAKIRVGDWAGGGPGNLRLGDLPTNTNLAPGSPSGLHIPTSFGEAMHFAPDAVRKMDALLDMPIHELGSIQIGDWAKLAAPAGTLRLDNVAGLGAIGHLTPAGNPAGALSGLPTTSIGHVAPVGAPATTLHALPSTTTMPGVGATPHTSSLAALDLVQPAMTHRPNTPTVVGGPLHNAGQLPSPAATMPHVDLRPVELGAPSTGAPVTPAALASGPPPTALTHERVGNALSLLDNGPSSVHVADSPA